MQPLSYLFGTWKPDPPHLLNPAFPASTKEFFSGGEISLLTAQNVIWTSRGYRPFLPLVGSPALPSQCLGGAVAYDRNGNIQRYAGTATDLYQLVNGAWVKRSRTTPAWVASTAYTTGQFVIDSNGNLQTVTTGGTSGTSAPTWSTTVGGTTTDNTVTWSLTHLGAYDATQWSFQNMGGCMAATNGSDPIQSIDMTTGTAFADLDDTDPAPIAGVLGMIRDFLVAGNIQSALLGSVPYGIQWSALANINQWPTPDTQNAYAVQAGSQTLYSEYGPVQAISDNESFGLIFQHSGISRAEYVGGNTVFQFYTYEKKRGALGPWCVARVGNKYFYASPDGFMMTDGSTTTPIGYPLVDKWFFANADLNALNTICAAADTRQKIVFFAFQSTSGSGLDTILVYNYEEQAWSVCDQTLDFLLQDIGDSAWVPGGFSTSHAYGQFTGTPGTATLISQDLQLNPAGRAVTTMVRPLTDGSPSVAVGTRNRLSDTSTLTSYYAANERSGVAGVRAEGVYHRIAVELNGAFNDCVGATVFAEEAGIL